MGKATVVVLFFLAFVYFILLAFDLASNILSLLPFIGTAFETVSESIIEAISAVIYVFTLLVAAKWGNER